jgi:hypothetical protein
MDLMGACMLACQLLCITNTTHSAVGPSSQQKMMALGMGDGEHTKVASAECPRSAFAADVN